MSQEEDARRKRLKREDSAAIEALLNLNAATTKIPKQTIRTTRKVLENEKGDVIIKGAWSPEEDKVMLEACNRFGFDWKRVASCVKGRSAKQCRDRYRLKLDPSINHGPWTPAEDEKLLQLHNEIGRSWTKIAKFLPGRTENAVKSRYSSLFRAKTKEWSEGEEQLLQTLHTQGVSFEVIAKQHLPHRSEHAVKKRWEKLLMKQIAKKIKQKLPTLNRESSSESRGNLPKLNPTLAAATLSTVSRLEEKTPKENSKEKPTLLNPSLNSNIGLLSSFPSAFNTVNSSAPAIGLSNLAALNSNVLLNSRLKRNLSASSNTSTGSAFLLPSLASSSLEQDKSALEEKEAEDNETEVAQKNELRNKTLEKVKTKSRRLKRYSTSTTVMMQLIGEPLNIA